ncbi:hypothetical protein M0R45_021935 [Rubus argutus]|uniref:Hexosyltransferase n=1 Tax=Rubus argutus TaxID=59490 RepID=A0AAW1XF06_RUBAR
MPPNHRRLCTILLILVVTVQFPAESTAVELPKFREAPAFRNGRGCPRTAWSSHSHNPSIIHIAMTLDATYLRGSVACVFSVLQHATCPENIVFHFIATHHTAGKTSAANGNRIYELGSLPPFLLVFAGDVEGVEHRWNQHGLGGDNLEGLCRDLHPGPVSLLHWSGKGKPWLRLDSKRPCPLDSLWAPYDLFRHSSLFADS